MNATLLNGFKPTGLKLSELREIMKSFKCVKTYNFFGNDEYTFYTSNGIDLACYNINTKVIYVTDKIFLS